MNQVTLIGRLVKEVELRFIPGSGQAVANFTIACDKGLSKEKIHGVYCLLEQGYVEPSSVCLSHKYKSTKNKEENEYE